MGKTEKFKFETLEVYQRAKRLAKRIYLLTENWPKKYLYDLTSQFRRAILSALLNVAEGSGRGKKEFARYLDIAIGSCKECTSLGFRLPPHFRFAQMCSLNRFCNGA